MSKEAIDELKRLRSILSGITGLEDDDQEYIEDARKSVDRIIEALAEQPAPPPECQTEAEKTAYAFGWFKALESVRKRPAQQEPKKDLMYSTVAMQERHAAFVDRAVATLEQAKREALAEKPAQQEPVAYVKTVIEALYENSDPVSVEAAELLEQITAPPQRIWQGLTDEEVVNRANAEVFAEAFARGVAWAELKLKEKNT